MKRYVWLLGVALTSVAVPTFAVEEPFCVVPENCVDDVLGVQFVSNNTAELANVNVNDEFQISTYLDCKSTPVQGFSYGVKHDTALLQITEATHRGTGVLHSIITTPAGEGGVDFKVTRIAQDNLGFIQAVVVTQDADPPLAFPIENGIKVSLAKYKVIAAVPPAGTKIQYTNDIQPPNSPKTATNLTINGKSKQPKNVNNGVVKGATGPEPCTQPDYAFYFGPAATATAFAIPAGQGGKQSVPVSLRNKGIALGFSLGIKKAGAALSLDDTLGSPAVELVVTKEDGKEASGAALKGNTATGAADTGNISAIAKGAALAGITGDFFGTRILATGVEGGPGATVGYVADASGNNRNIPAVTDTATTCGVNEILVVEISTEVQPPRFSRGDGNGDGKINVTDGVILAQNIFANRLVVFDCKDMLDANDDGQTNTADPVFLLSYVFLKGPQPAAPFKACAADPTNDTLQCAQPNCQ